MIFYTDGSCSNNGVLPNVGGYGIVGLNNDGTFSYSVGKEVKNTTNNRMEMTAIIEVLESHGLDSETPVVFTDSAYCVNTFTNWIFGWRDRGWKKSDKKTPENLDLLQKYMDLLSKGHKIQLKKVAGHNGIFWNEIADKLATREYTEEKVKEIVKNG